LDVGKRSSLTCLKVKGSGRSTSLPYLSLGLILRLMGLRSPIICSGFRAMFGELDPEAGHEVGEDS